MNQPLPEKLGLIAGKGVYPCLLAQSAKRHGVKYLFTVAFKGETEPGIKKIADDIKWLNVGQLTAMLEALRASGVKQVVMAGQITPTHLFRLRPDARILALLSRLRVRNADTIFGAIADELKSFGIELLPAYLFMEDAMPAAGQLSARAPSEQERKDIELGMKVAKITSGLAVGQTVVVKEGTILAVEAFEGTDETVRRAGRLGGPGAVVVKVARGGHDMRFDIPVVGLKTIQVLKKIKAGVLALEADHTILLERNKLCAAADRIGLALLAL